MHHLLKNESEVVCWKGDKKFSRLVLQKKTFTANRIISIQKSKKDFQWYALNFFIIFPTPMSVPVLPFLLVFLLETDLFWRGYLSVFFYLSYINQSRKGTIVRNPNANELNISTQDLLGWRETLLTFRLISIILLSIYFILSG